MSQHSLWYKSPARCWDEALPIGNGRIGAMVFGRTDEETVELNEDTLWGGYPRRDYPENYFANLLQARRLLEEGKLAEADGFISREMLRFDSAGYLPAGRLKLKFHSPEQADYRRCLDLRAALLSVASRGESCEWLASHPHQVIAMRYRGAGFALTLDSPLEHDCGIEGRDLLLNGRCPVFARRTEIRQGDELRECGIRFQIRVRIAAEPGTVRGEGDGLVFSGGEATVLLAIRTSFLDWKSMPDAADYPEQCRADLDRAEKLSFEELRRIHAADHQSFYLRSALELPEQAEDRLPTDERLARCREGFTPALAALLYQFGRYLLIASSRPGTQPANLQGIWNPLPLPPWGSNYTTNINLEMNYWPVEGANLAECAEPLFRFTRECAESGRETARTLYHASGWCLHHNSDLWRYTGPASGQARWGFWPVAGLWLCRHIFEHYEYGRDAEFLREYYPVLRGAAEFLLDFLVRTDAGEYVTSPSTSPENGFLDPATGKAVCVCGGGSAMDLELARESLEHFLEAGRILGVDEPLSSRAQEVLRRLRPLGTGSEGELLEYDADYREAEINHRHLSHLYGAYPGELFTPERNPELFRAAETSLVRRGDHSTGWAMGWRLALWARFRNSGKTKTMLKEFLTPIDPTKEINYRAGGIYPNLFSAHPPFQIDANFGVVAGILEMLVQSHRKAGDGKRLIELLPAIPDDWSEGAVSGVRCRNGVTLSFAWKGRTVTALEIHPELPEDCRIVAPPGGEIRAAAGSGV